MSSEHETLEQDLNLPEQDTGRSLKIMAAITLVLAVAVYLLGFVLRSDDMTARDSKPTSSAERDTSAGDGKEAGSAGDGAAADSGSDGSDGSSGAGTEDGMANPWPGNVPDPADQIVTTPDLAGAGETDSTGVDTATDADGSIDGSDTAPDSGAADSPGTGDAAVDAAGTVAPAALHEELLTALNRYRTRRGCPILIEDERLSRAAVEHSHHMAAVGRLGINDLGDGTPASRAEEQGFTGAKLRDLVAASTQTPRIVADDWRSDRPSWKKITDCSAWHVGLGIVQTRTQTWWTVTMAQDAPKQ